MKSVVAIAVTSLVLLRGAVAHCQTDDFVVHTSDGAGSLRVGGFLQLDARTFVDDAANPLVDQFTFRSTRALFEGSLRDLSFRFMPDFAGGKLVVQDAYTDVRISDSELEV